VNQGRAPLSALGVRAIDRRTLEITLDHPAPYLPEILKHQIALPVPKHVVERWGEAWVQPRHYVSNGPYTLVAWRLGDRVEVERNPRFYDAKSVCIDKVDYYPSADAVAAERRVGRGELDVSTDIESNRVAYLRQPDRMPGYVRIHTYLGLSYLAFNTKSAEAPGLADRRVRLALSMALDRAFVTGKLLRAGQTPAYAMVPPGTANYQALAPPVWAAWPLARRQAAARVLLARAGFGPGHPLKIEYKHANTPELMLIAPAIQADWKAIGVTTTLAEDDTQILYQDLRIRNFQVAGAAWIADYDDATSFLQLQQSQTGAQNYGDYSNPLYDALLAKADHEPDAKVRAGYLERAEAIMLGDVAVAPTYFRVNKNLVSPAVTGWVDNLLDNHRTRYLCFKGHAAAAPFGG
jgi:oligopeptide transport system substrate-binding protein